MASEIEQLERPPELGQLLWPNEEIPEDDCQIVMMTPRHPSFEPGGVYSWAGMSLVCIRLLDDAALFKSTEPPCSP